MSPYETICMKRQSLLSGGSGGGGEGGGGGGGLEIKYRLAENITQHANR